MHYELARAALKCTALLGHGRDLMPARRFLLIPGAGTFFPRDSQQECGVYLSLQRLA
jgi:hypothetical protein